MRPFSALIATVIALTVSASGCGSEPPSSRVSRGHVRIEREAPSPDGRLVARYSVIWGGGAAGYVQEVVELRTPGDTAAPDEATSMLDMSHGGDVTMTWHDPRHLEIVYPAWAEIWRGCHAARGVAIRFTARATPDSLWRDAARIEWESVRILEANLGRRGEPLVRDSSPGLVGSCP